MEKFREDCPANCSMKCRIQLTCRDTAEKVAGYPAIVRLLRFLAFPGIRCPEAERTGRKHGGADPGKAFKINIFSQLMYESRDRKVEKEDEKKYRKCEWVCAFLTKKDRKLLYTSKKWTKKVTNR